MKKFIFLDIDGVLNNTNLFIMRYYQNTNSDKEEWEMINDGLYTIDQRNVIALNMLIEVLQREGHEIEIVISSAWRSNMKIVMERLREFKVKTVGEKELRRTMLKHMDRGLQILEFCKENEISVDDIIVIDDDSGDIVDHIPAPNFIHTFFENGLTFLDVHRFLLSLNYKIFKHE